MAGGIKDVAPNLKPFGMCPCKPGCGLEGKYKTRKFSDGSLHVRGCSCSQCSGRKSKRSGNTGQRNAARRAGTPKVGSMLAGHEEHYGGTIRQEIKTGAQVNPAVTAFDKARAQSEQHRPIGDTRPFVLHIVPKPNGKRIITAFESNSDDEYKTALEAMGNQVGLFSGGDEAA